MARDLRFNIIATDRASGVFQRVGRSVGRSFTGMAKIAGAALVGATAAMGGLAVAGTVMGVKTAASLEQATIAFTTLLKSGKKAEAFLADLKKFAAQTPFELPGLVSAARQLIGVGQSAESVIPTLRAWGDAAGALGLSQDQFERAMLAVTQAISKGKVQAEELLQITEAGVPIWPLLARAMGKTVPELQKLASEGKLLAKDVFPALEEQMGKDYGGSMAKQSQTLSGLWSTFMDTLNLGLADAIEPLIPALKEGLTGAIEKVSEALEDGADILAGFIDGLDDGEAKLEGWAEKAQSLGKAVKATIAAVEDFAAKLGFKGGGFKMPPWMESIRDWFAEVISAVKVIKPAWDNMMKVVGPGMTDAVNDLKAAWKDLQPAFEAIKPAAKFAAILIGFVLVGAVFAAAAVFRGLAAVIRFVIVPAINFFAKVFSAGANMTLDLISGLLTGFRSLVDVAASIPGPHQSAMRKLSTAIGGAIARIDQLREAINSTPPLTVSVDDRQALASLKRIRVAIAGVRADARLGIVVPVQGGGRITERAHGGPVRKGQPVIVGERRPELFVPDSNGRILPRVPAATSAMGSGQSTQLLERLLEKLSTPQLPSRVRLVVDGREFTAFVESRAEVAVANGAHRARVGRR